MAALRQNPTPGEPGEDEGEGDGYGDEAHEGDWEPGHGDDEEGFIAHEKPDWIFGEEVCSLQYVYLSASSLGRPGCSMYS
jgi:hypothetical protein